MICRSRFLYITFALFMIASLAWAQDDPTVYITRTGAKYHTAGCRYLKKSSIPISLSEAIERGYTPCSVCHPPTKVSATIRSSHFERSTGQTSSAAIDLYRVNIAGLTSSSQADTSLMLPAHVYKHVDGDTVHVEIKDPPAGLKSRETIRMIGVDTPETLDPQKPVQAFGKEASEYTESRLLAFDWDLRDKDNRLLAYIYFSDGACFNSELVAEGYGHAYLEFPFQFYSEFMVLESKARQEKKGLWGE